MNYYDIPFVNNSFLTKVYNEVYGKFQVDFSKIEHALEFGKMVDAALTEPHLLSEYSNHERLPRALQIAEDVKSNPEMWKIFEPSINVLQKEFYGRLEGLMCKSRLDSYCKELSRVGELKTTSCTSEKSFFGQSFYEIGYHRQMAMYMMKSKADYHVYVVCPSGEGLKPFMRTFDRNSVQFKKGREEVLKLLRYVKKVYPKADYDPRFPKSFQPTVMI